MGVPPWASRGSGVPRAPPAECLAPAHRLPLPCPLHWAAPTSPLAQPQDGGTWASLMSASPGLASRALLSSPSSCLS